MDLTVIEKYLTRDQVIALLKQYSNGGVCNEANLRILARQAAHMLHRDRATDKP